MKDKISVVLPVYNCEKYIDRCIDSIINQTYKNFEIILVNDGSTDNSLNLLKKYKKKDKRIILIDKKNEGVSVARNIAIDRSSGDYITFVDADDYLEKDALETMINLIKKEKVDILRTTYYKIKNDSIKFEKIIYNGKIKLTPLNKEKIIESILNQSLHCYLWILLIKRDVIIKNNIFFEKELYVHQDIDYYLSLIINSKTIYFSDKLTYYYVYNESGSKNLENARRNIISNINLSYILVEKLGYNYYNLINILSLNLIFMYFSPLYKNNKEEFKQIYNMLLNDNRFNKIVKNLDKNKAYKSMSPRYRIYFSLIKKKCNFNILLIAFKIRYLFLKA